MKREEQMKKAAKLIIATSMAAFVAACGGGGDGGSSNTGGSSGGSNPTPVQQNATDPYTGQPAAGSATNQISGSVVSGATAGATVTVYTLNNDGTNGDAIGTAITDASGAFSIALRQAPTGMIRIVATGGTFSSEADASTQSNATLELVAPYVTSALNTFVVTPVTHYASQRVSYLTKQGQSLIAAYRTASSAAVSVLSGLNAIATANRAHSGVDYLAITPGSSQDTLNAYADALKALEYYGVKYDLPSHTTVRIFIATSIAGSNGVTDQNGQAVNVGAWSGQVFNESTPLTVASMAGGISVQDGVASIVQQMNATQACASGDHTAFYARYPLAAGQSDYLDSTTCATYTSNMNAISAKIPTNNRSKYVG
ncbi:hypothetical protein BLA23254_06881 [Burkholderia lata]|uniref:Lipoprotein n=1 Tax=Burkholderia lata (strain ATCC 17760 / DSM 23089 / LMG 22485 / NCIMB 9086 / R18194 / 383) TaxID=482957 RepID=A0A6P2S790_BURL3|nr:hypothetical protein [Burkholderia lata]VWC39845.1 hypothetical protein BLA23254_06881 [Burkholderia lata]